MIEYKYRFNFSNNYLPGQFLKTGRKKNTPQLAKIVIATAAKNRATCEMLMVKSLGTKLKLISKAKKF